MKVVMICSECKHEPQPDKEKSNENWQVYTKCPKCGGHLKPVVR